MTVPHPPAARRKLRVALVAIFALVALNIALAHQNMWPSVFARATAEFSLELAVLVTGLALAAEAGWRLGRRRLWALSAFLFVLVLARYVDVTAPALFGRRIDLYWDTQHIPAVAAMILESWPPLRVAALLLALAIAAAALLIAIRFALGAIWQGAQQPITRRAGAAIGLILLGVYAAGMRSDTLDWERRFAIPVTPVYFEQLRTISARLSGNFETPSLSASLRGPAELNGADVFVIFLESYGRIALDDEAYSAATRAKLSELEEALSAAGWSSRSAFLTPPTFGGASWLSHSSFLSGNRIDSHDLYQAFLHQGSQRLTDIFRNAGYRNILLSPGIRGPWPAGLALGFDDIAPAKSVAYEGPSFGWWQIPDQYSLEWVYRTEIAQTDRKPLFIMFPTIMSHFPFGPTPPYAADWSVLSTAEPFAASEVAESLARGDAVSGDPQAAYLRGILYNLETISGFVTERASEGAIVIALGDHQPPAAISGQDADWDIPIHVFARDESQLARFEDAGFAAGMIPAGASSGRIEELPILLIETLDAAAPANHVAGVD